MSRNLRTRAFTVVPALGLAVATALAFAGSIQPAGASTPKLYASPTGSGVICGKTSKCTLAEAMIKALPGTTIELDAGIYNNQLTINKANLTIQGPKSGTATLRKTAAAVNAATPAAAPVTALVYAGSAGTGFTLADVTVDGSAANLPSATRFAGVYVRSSNATIDHVAVTGIFPGTGFDGNQNGVGIYVRTDGASSSNVTVSSDTLTHYNKNGLACADTGTTCTVSNTTATGQGATTITAQNGLQIGFGAGGSITGSTVTGNHYTPSPQATGILIYNAASGVSITKNTVSGNDNGIYAANDGSGPGTSANVSITKNKASNPTAFDNISLADITGGTVAQNKTSGSGALTGYGIGLYGATNNTVTKNKVSGSQFDGIYIGGPGYNVATSTLNHVTFNKVTGSGGDGIHADTPSSNNTFTGNTTKNSSGFDAHDQGTSNTWSNTHCTTHASSAPLGIC